MSTERVMLLIDADNVSMDVVEQAVRLLMNQHGAVHVRRAYCTAESAVKHQVDFKRLGIKPMVNLAAGKNSTDIALAVDAVDLVLAERPDVVVIASSDSDFAPLVHRLREKGCVVRGIGQQGKTADETRDVYDDFTVLEHHKSSVAAKTTRARSATARAAKAGPVTTDVSSAPPPPRAPKKAPAAKKTTARGRAEPAASASLAGPAVPASAAAAAAAAGAAAPAVPAKKAAARKRGKAAASADLAATVQTMVKAPEPISAVEVATPGAKPRLEADRPTTRTGNRGTLQAVLDCLPELPAGKSLALNVAVQRLREAQLLGKNSSSLKLFAQLSGRFELSPAGNPTQVRWRD